LHVNFPFDYLVVNENNINIIPASPSLQQQQQRSLLNIVDENSTDNQRIQSSPIIDEARSNISSSIGPVASTPSPTSIRKPVSLTSTKAYFTNIQQYSSSPILQVKTIIHNDDEYEDKESIKISTRPRTSSLKHGDKRDMIATVRFTDENGTNIEETYL